MDGTVRFTVNIRQVLIHNTGPLYQEAQVEFKHVSTSTDGWTAAYILLHVRPHFPPQAYMFVPGAGGNTQQVTCTPQRFRADPDTDTYSADIPNACIPVGDAKVNVRTFFRHSKYGSTDNLSRDKLGVRAAVR
jgi:hypothetical protein